MINSDLEVNSRSAGAGFSEACRLLEFRPSRPSSSHIGSLRLSRAAGSNDSQNQSVTRPELVHTSAHHYPEIQSCYPGYPGHRQSIVLVTCEITGNRVWTFGQVGPGGAPSGVGAGTNAAAVDSDCFSAKMAASRDELTARINPGRRKTRDSVEYKPGMSSTLVETVSINYEDFNDSFLTCGTCLCTYDNQEHNPKLLTCSHTVCRSCLERIIESQTRDTGTFRCPICRETIAIPRGGVVAFPPSFIVNQLLDLMASHRRDVIPKCSVHIAQELLFCESCDMVFCTICTGGSHNGRAGASEHTVIPFSIAIKRMSEILLYKAHMCIRNLTAAHEIVSEEIGKLDDGVEGVVDDVNRSFDDVIAMVEKRRHDMLHAVKKVREEKKKVLREQLELIDGEKCKVQNECEGLQYQVEVRNITKKISDLNEKLDALALLSEPRENAFLKYDFRHNTAQQGLQNCLNHFGRVRISTTYPALSMTQLPRVVVMHLSSSVAVTTVDYHGNPRTDGGDPVTVDLRCCDAGVAMDNQPGIPCKLVDNNNGTYNITFVANQLSGQYKLSVNIFDRPIKDSPYILTVTEHNNPVSKFGCRGTGDLCFTQPVNIAIGHTARPDGQAVEFIYVLDTGNSRIKCLDSQLRFVRHYDTLGLEHQSGTGIALSPPTPSTGQQSIYVVNWRSKYVTELSESSGEVLSRFTSPHFQEPINLCVSSRNEIIVADNGSGHVYVFNRDGKVVNKIGCKGDKAGQFKLISSVVCLQGGAGKEPAQILVADNRLQVFNIVDGRFIRQIGADVNTSRGQYGSVAVDKDGWILATRTEKGRSFVQVFSHDGKFQFIIDSFDDKLKRASGLACSRNDSGNNHYVYVIDLGNDCVKKYRYK